MVVLPVLGPPSDDQEGLLTGLEHSPPLLFGQLDPDLDFNFG